MVIELDDDGEVLKVDGEEFYARYGDAFDVLASRLDTARLSDLPKDVRVQLCDPVGGSHELCPRGSCVFERTFDDELIASSDVAFFLEEDDVDQASLASFFRKALDGAHHVLAPLRDAGLLAESEEKIFDNIAYLTYVISLPDQRILDAEEYMHEIEARIYEGADESHLFVCYASEDGLFVERLVKELDRRALYAWFDKREIFVGDSIVSKINQGLSKTRYFIVVLSPHAVIKPWVTRELNSTLMRQLSEGNVTILPVLAEKCQIPPLLMDFKYADFTEAFEKGLDQLLSAIRAHSRRG